MTPVSPAEFADMRDFSDGATVFPDRHYPQQSYEYKREK